MMNKSKIDWCDFSWNPVTGCLHKCDYCYARKQARRFCGDIRLNKGTGQIKQYIGDDMTSAVCYTLEKPFKNAEGETVGFPVGFAPILHEYRLTQPAEKKKPANIFVCSMADLFGEWMPESWIERVFEACEAAPWHNYLFLTKNPQRYCDLANKKKLPKHDNFWYGTTVTQKGASIFGGSIHYNTFISIEPLLESLDTGLGSFSNARWIIVGAETGQRRGKIKPERAWIENIVETARLTGASVLLKDSDAMREVWGDDLIQEFPKELIHETVIIPHCEECQHVTREPQGDRGTAYFCGLEENRHIPAQYKRTSPPWCLKRRKE